MIAVPHLYTHAMTTLAYLMGARTRGAAAAEGTRPWRRIFGGAAIMRACWRVASALNAVPGMHQCIGDDGAQSSAHQW